MKEQKVVSEYTNKGSAVLFKEYLAAGWEVVSLDIESNHLGGASHGETGIYVVALLEELFQNIRIFYVYIRRSY